MFASRSYRPLISRADPVWTEDQVSKRRPAARYCGTSAYVARSGGRGPTAEQV